MNEYYEEFKTKKVANLILRAWHEDDLEKVMEFYRSFPPEEIEMMRYDVTDEDEVRARYQQMHDSNIDKLLMLDGDTDKVIGDATLQPMRLGWMRKTGEIRSRLLPDYRNVELGNILTREIFLFAAKRGMDDVVVKLLKEDVKLFEIFTNLNFLHVVTQKNQVVDHKDRTHDVNILTFSLRRMWADIENSLRAVSSNKIEH